jgi:dTDP-D-glucose 4,6-dehydratase
MDKFYPGKDSYLKLITYAKDRPGHDFKFDINSYKIRKEIKWNKKNNFNKNIEKLFYGILTIHLIFTNIQLKKIDDCKKIKSN